MDEYTMNFAGTLAMTFLRSALMDGGSQHRATRIERELVRPKFPVSARCTFWEGVREGEEADLEFFD